MWGDQRFLRIKVPTGRHKQTAALPVKNDSSLTYISVSVASPWAVTGPYWQLASVIILAASSNMVPYGLSRCHAERRISLCIE